MLKLDSFKSIKTNTSKVVGGKGPTGDGGDAAAKYTYTLDGIHSGPDGGTPASSSDGGITWD